MMDIASKFHAGQAVCFLLWWVLLKNITGKHLYDVGSVCGSVCTRPPWLPARALRALHRRRRAIFIFAPVAQALACWRATLLARLLAACAVSCYHLVETSVTHRHGEFPVLYISWAMVLPPAIAHACALGVGVHFVFSSGLAKLAVGGAAWLAPETLRFYLSVYAASASAKPASPRLSAWARARPWATAALAAATVALECALVPATLVAPAAWRFGFGACGMIALHVGIALLMSAQVALAFFTVLPSYLVAFSCPAAAFTPHAGLAALVGLLAPGAWCAARRGLLPEAWPVSPVNLFLWNGAQARALATQLMTGDTRVVMSADAQADIVGRTVMHHGAVMRNDDDATAKGVVHDSVLRVVGFTIVQGDLYDAAPERDGEWNISRFVQKLEEWLARERRVVEMRTGRPLVRAYFVRIADKKVAEVLVPR